MYVCNCAGVTQKEIESAIASGADSMQALRQTLNVAKDCCQCACEVKRCLRRSNRQCDNHISQGEWALSAG